MLEISYDGLKSRNFLDNKGISETQFLDPLFNIVETNETSADSLIKDYNLDWNQKIDCIFEKKNF